MSFVTEPEDRPSAAGTLPCMGARCAVLPGAGGCEDGALSEARTARRAGMEDQYLPAHRYVHAGPYPPDPARRGPGRHLPGPLLRQRCGVGCAQGQL